MCFKQFILNIIKFNNDLTNAIKCAIHSIICFVQSLCYGIVVCRSCRSCGKSILLFQIEFLGNAVLTNVGIKDLDEVAKRIQQNATTSKDRTRDSLKLTFVDTSIDFC